MDLKKLLERRAQIWAQMQDIITSAETERRDLSAEEAERYDKLEAELNDLTGQIDRAQRHAAHADEFGRIDERTRVGRGEIEESDDAPSYEDAFRSWARYGTNALSTEERHALAGRFQSGAELRAQGIATGGAGGYLVPEGFRTQLIETMLAFGSVESVATVIETESGNPLLWPAVDDTANVGAILAENTQVTEQDIVFTEAGIDAYMYTSKLVRVSYQLLQDSAFDLDAFLRRKLAERIARILNQHFTTGTGSSQPDGVATSPTVGKTGTTGQTTSVTYADLVDLIHSIDPAYRNDRSRFMLKDATLASIRKLLDGNNIPLWQPSLQAGVPDTILGYPVTVNQDMPTMAANAYPILFGDFQEYYLIRRVRDIQLLRLEERYADYLQVGFLAFARYDGTKVNMNAVKAYRNSAT